jgi:hypothetical protein
MAIDKNARITILREEMSTIARAMSDKGFTQKRLDRINEIKARIKSIEIGHYPVETSTYKSVDICNCGNRWPCNSEVPIET